MANRQSAAGTGESVTATMLDTTTAAASVMRTKAIMAQKTVCVVARYGARDAMGGDCRGGVADHGGGVACASTFSRTELAPVEDQSHTSLFFEASPDSTLAASNRDHLKVVDVLTSFPETDFTWSLTSAWGGFGGLVAKDWKKRTRSTEEMDRDVFGAVSQVSGLRVFPRLDPPLPTPGQYDVELVLQSDAPVERMLETAKAVLEAGWKSGKFLYVDTDLKIDMPEASRARS